MENNWTTLRDKGKTGGSAIEKNWKTCDKCETNKNTFEKIWKIDGKRTLVEKRWKTNRTELGEKMNSNTSGRRVDSKC